jgi:hypothetical protein
MAVRIESRWRVERSMAAIVVAAASACQQKC